MFGGSRISLASAAQLSRRLATSLEAGVDIRRVFAREAVGGGTLPGQLEPVAARIQQGYTLSDALNSAGNYFPPLFRELVEVGERTGKLPEVFRSLAENYENQLALRRSFRATIAWPMLQLGAAIFIIGFLIWVMGLIGNMTNSEPMNILGITVMGQPLVGNRGLAIYVAFIGLMAAVTLTLVQVVKRGTGWGQTLEALVLRIPVLGRSLQTLVLSRFAWALEMTLEAGMGVLEALPLSLRTTQSPRYRAMSDDVTRGLKQGREIHEVLRDAGGFPASFLDSIEVGERSGRLPETMAVVSRQYQDQARQALATLTMLAGFAVWAIVAGIIILMVFRIFTQAYLGPINEALQGV